MTPSSLYEYSMSILVTLPGTYCIPLRTYFETTSTSWTSVDSPCVKYISKSLVLLENVLWQKERLADIGIVLGTFIIIGIMLKEDFHENRSRK